MHAISCSFETSLYKMETGVSKLREKKLGFQSWEILDCRGTSYTSWFQTILDSSSAQGSLVLLVNLSEVTYYLKVISETLVVPSNKSSL